MLFKKKGYYIKPYASVLDESTKKLLSYNDYVNNNLTSYLGISGFNPLFLNLIDCPHILISGSTKSGKSVCINTLLLSLMLKNNPNELELYIIDPKKVDYCNYRHSPFVKGYTDNINETAIILNRIYNVMMSRFQYLQSQELKNLDNVKGFSQIVIVFDEFASFGNKDGKKNIIPTLQELLRLGRAVNVHVIIATQRPDRQIIDGQLKANCPTRIAFRLPSKTDSRIILDCNGAEMLQGKGDGILLNSDGTKTRFQGFMFDEPTEKRILDFWKRQPLTKRQIDKMINEKHS